ncbi:energy-coupling factor transporter transmembrane component T family protein [Nocardia jinanensis]|uniref:Cobalt ABC transporter permease n=1 Tax=Nocardia jinanensis TaxID=382504 RepID=A0A917VJA0_9NOCA|nr:energy-coupling factor transporter transmembrane component T [Nocardia jinanensis]GGK89874.1 cobalt ABC transporter permease [Nocardia jinanensis]
MEAPRYLAGDSFLGRRDPRVLILVPALTVLAVTQIRDLRLMAVAAVLALGFYASARIPFHAVRANWITVGIFVFLLAGINGLIVGARQYGSTATELFRLPLLDISVSTASVSYTVVMVLRFLAIALTGFPLAFAVRPGDLSVAFARLGVPARFAYAIDLTFRFLPTIAANLRETIAAQRLRGYEVSATRNPVRRVRELQPLIVPVTVGAFVEAEDIADALDLRGFGTGRRTWLRVLRFDNADRAVLALFIGVAGAVTVAKVTGRMPGLWLW